MYIGMSVEKVKSLNKPLEEELHVQTSLLVPAALIGILKNATNKIGIPKFLGQLIDKFELGILMREVEMSKKTTVKHQVEGLDLQKLSVEPLASDWAEFGILASALGITRCRLFTLLLRLFQKWESGRYVRSLWKKFGIDSPCQERKTPIDYTIFTMVGMFMEGIYRRELHYGT
jgi:hypothetical protein